MDNKKESVVDWEAIKEMQRSRRNNYSEEPMHQAADRGNAPRGQRGRGPSHQGRRSLRPTPTPAPVNTQRQRGPRSPQSFAPMNTQGDNDRPPAVNNSFSNPRLRDIHNPDRQGGYDSPFGRGTQAPGNSAPGSQNEQTRWDHAGATGNTGAQVWSGPFGRPLNERPTTAIGATGNYTQPYNRQQPPPTFAPVNNHNRTTTQQTPMVDITNSCQSPPKRSASGENESEEKRVKRGPSAFGQSPESRYTEDPSGNEDLIDFGENLTQVNQAATALTPMLPPPRNAANLGLRDAHMGHGMDGDDVAMQDVEAPFPTNQPLPRRTLGGLSDSRWNSPESNVAPEWNPTPRRNFAPRQDAAPEWNRPREENLPYERQYAPQRRHRQDEADDSDNDRQQMRDINLPPGGKVKSGTSKGLGLSSSRWA